MDPPCLCPCQVVSPEEIALILAGIEILFLSLKALSAIGTLISSSAHEGVCAFFPGIFHAKLSPRKCPKSQEGEDWPPLFLCVYTWFFSPRQVVSPEEIALILAGGRNPRRAKSGPPCFCPFYIILGFFFSQPSCLPGRVSLIWPGDRRNPRRFFQR